MEKNRTAIVVLSGGQDSTTCLFWALRFYDRVFALSFDYGQRHVAELEYARKVAELAQVNGHEIVDVRNLLHSVSPLVTSNPLEQYTDAAQMEKVIGNRRELTFVPMRNALFLTIAANRAEALGGADIVTGVCQMDNANYDDCREVFIDATTEYINTALGHDHRGTPPIRIVTPLMKLTKAQTVHMAFDNPEAWAALAYTHTSYDGQYPPTDMNHANVLRAQGFEEAGRPDPLVLRAYKEGLMELPKTDNYSAKSLAEAGVQL
jgi:7-cyano-7-deazaguanine synthase